MFSNIKFLGVDRQSIETETPGQATEVDIAVKRFRQRPLHKRTGPVDVGKQRQSGQDDDEGQPSEQESRHYRR